MKISCQKVRFPVGNSHTPTAKKTPCLLSLHLDSKMIVGFQRTLYSDIINTSFDLTLAFQSTVSLITRKIQGKIDDDLPF